MHTVPAFSSPGGEPPRRSFRNMDTCRMCKKKNNAMYMVPSPLPMVGREHVDACMWRWPDCARCHLWVHLPKMTSMCSCDSCLIDV